MDTCIEKGMYLHDFFHVVDEPCNVGSSQNFLQFVFLSISVYFIMNLELFLIFLIFLTSFIDTTGFSVKD